MKIFQMSFLLLNSPVNSFFIATKTHTPLINFKTKSYHESLFRAPIPGEEITLPKVNQPSGEYLIDRFLIEKVASLRTFIETIEVNRGKDPSSLMLNDSKVSQNNEYENPHKELVEINEENLEPIRDLLAEEDLLEEVLAKAFEAYRLKNDNESIERLQDISEQIVPIASKLRKEKSEMNITRLISCYMDGNEDIDKVLEELQEKKALDKYLMTRLDELINLAAKKFRISDEHPAVSEEFLKILKDRIASQRITDIRGTNLFVKTLALCFQTEESEDWDNIVKENLRKIEDIEEFHQWLLDGIEYCKTNNRMKDKVGMMEKLVDVVFKQHPIWNPKEDYIQYEGFKQEDRKIKESIL